jgi:diguanylate cyclase (GGDEF)-like protein
MSLDMRTIVVMLLLSAVLMTLTLAFGLRAGAAKGFGKWNIGLGLFAGGWLLIAARPILPDLLGIAVADGLLLTGLCFQLGALYEYDGRRAPPVLLAVPGPLLALLLVPLMNDYAALTLLASAAYAAAMLTLARQVVRLGPAGAGPVRWPMAGFLALGALALLLRAADIALRHEAGLFFGNALHVATFMLLFAITITSSFAFLVMQRGRAETELRHLAMYDPLTEVYNRRAFMELAEREVARARRTHGPFAVLMMDLDRFKRINDEFGHQAGDRVLAAFAALAKGNVRAPDIVGRYGGEEFCALLPATGAAEAHAVAERIRGAVRERPLGGLPAAITVSIGLAVCDTGDCPLDAMIGQADEALYLAKRAGRDRVVGVPARLLKSA